MTERRRCFLFLSGLAVVASSVLAPAWSSAATTPPPPAPTEAPTTAAPPTPGTTLPTPATVPATTLPTPATVPATFEVTLEAASSCTPVAPLDPTVVQAECVGGVVTPASVTPATRRIH